MARNFDFSQAASKGITVLPDVTVAPNPTDIMVVKNVTAGAVNLGFQSAGSLVGANATISDTPPAGAAVASLWWDSTGTGLYIRYNDGTSTQWVSTENQAAIGTVKISDIPPTAADSSLWWDSGGTGLYVRYNDGNSTQWVAAQNPYTLTDSPHDGAVYARQNGMWTSISNRTVVNVLDYGAKGDGVTNDYSALQGVLNSTGGKATIFLPDTGHPYMTDPLQVPSGTDLLIHGTLLLRPGAANSLLAFDNASNVNIRGHGVLDGNGSTQSVNGCGTLGGNNAHNVQVEGLTIQNAFNWNVNITASTNVKLDRVTVLGGVASNEFAVGCDNCWITNSTINGPSSDGGFTFYGGVTNSGITNCVLTNGYAGSVGVYNDVPQPAPCSNIMIANNIIRGNRLGGISVVNAGGTAGTLHTGIVITGNRLYANNNTGNIQYADIWISQGTGITISGNEISGSGSGSSATWGVFVGNASSHVNITGNTIYNEGIGGTAGGGVYIQAANDVLVSGNFFYDDQATHTMANAILGSAGARNAVVGNLFGILGGPAVTLTLAADTILNNAGPGANTIMALPPPAANDAAAAAAGVSIGGAYRNGSILMVRVA